MTTYYQEQEIDPKSDLSALKSLVVNYYFPCMQMHKLVHRNRFAALTKQEPQAWHRFQVYFTFWLSSLYVVCEGYLHLKLKNDKIDKIIHVHLSELRQFRNGAFHYQKSLDKQMKFIALPEGKLNWAEELHAAFKNFFGDWAEEAALEELLASEFQGSSSRDT